MKRKKRGIPDTQIFKDMTNFKPEHKQVIMNHLGKLIIKIKNDDITVLEAAKTLDGIANSIHMLVKKYENKSN